MKGYYYLGFGFFIIFVGPLPYFLFHVFFFFVIVTIVFLLGFVCVGLFVWFCFKSVNVGSLWMYFCYLTVNFRSVPGTVALLSLSAFFFFTIIIKI